MNRQDIEGMIRNLHQRNIEAVYFESATEAKSKILEYIPTGVTVGIGNSQTLKKMDISNSLAAQGHIVYDKTMAHSKEESAKIKKQALLSDWYITGTNAISEEGHIVNIDHSGNRVAAMIYGPDHVIVVVGTNKIAKNLDEAISRARLHAAPLNAKRAGFHPPCTELNQCVDCRTKERVCYNLVIIEGQYVEGRMKVIIVNEEMGY